MKQHEVDKGEGCSTSVRLTTICLNAQVVWSVIAVVVDCLLSGNVHHHLGPVLSSLDPNQSQKGDAEVLEVGVFVKGG